MNKTLFGGICYLILPTELKHFINYAEMAILCNLSYVCGEYSVYDDMINQLNEHYGDWW